MIQLIGFLLPPLIDTINRYIKSSYARFWVSVIVCAVIGTILDILSHNGLTGVTQESIAQSILMVFGSAQLSYKGVWENSKARANLIGDQ